MIRRILTNLVYIGKAEVNKGNKDADAPASQRRNVTRSSDGLSTPLIEQESFDRVQQVLKRNLSTRGNVVAVRKKSFLLAGVIRCGRAPCVDATSGEGPVMLTSSGTSKTGKNYYYYLCPKCKTRIPAGEIENLVATKIAAPSSDSERLRRLTDATNRIVTEEVPRLRYALDGFNASRSRRMMNSI